MSYKKLKVSLLNISLVMNMLKQIVTLKIEDVHFSKSVHTFDYFQKISQHRTVHKTLWEIPI